MKLFVVTSGEYSDRKITGIYSSKEKAEWARQLYATYNDIEEWELDSLPIHPPGMLLFMVRMDKSGTVVDFSHVDASGKWPRWSPAIEIPAVDFVVWARDIEHATKIANEQRTQLIAFGEWTTNYVEWRRRTHSKNSEPVGT